MFDLKAVRKSSGYTQQSLADKSGMNIRQIQKIEAGEIKIENITLKNAKSLADALGIQISALLA